MTDDRHMLGDRAPLEGTAAYRADDDRIRADRAGPQRTPRDPAGDADREQQLAVMVPAEVKAAVRRRAHEEGITVRALLLRLISEAGIAPVADADLADRRVAAAALKSRLYRDALRRG